jgi:hypothetical protein
MRKARALRMALAAAALPLAAWPAAAEYRGLLDCTVFDAPREGRLATCTGRVSHQHPHWTWVVRGEAPNRVTAIEIYEREKPEPRQVIKGFVARPALTPGDGREKGSIALILQDVNFDGAADLRLARGPAGDIGVRYRWWTFDKEKGEFVATDLLDEVLTPVINARRRSIVGAGTDARGRPLRVLYKWRNGRLDPSAAIARSRDDFGKCTLVHYVVKEGKFEKKQETECREKSDGEFE